MLGNLSDWCGWLWGFLFVGIFLIPWKTFLGCLNLKNHPLLWSWEKSSEASTSFLWDFYVNLPGCMGCGVFLEGSWSMDELCQKSWDNAVFIWHGSWMIMIFFFQDVWETFDGEWIEFIPSWIESGYFYIVIDTTIRFSCGDLLWESVTPKMTQRNLESTWMSTLFIQLYCWWKKSG